MSHRFDGQECPTCGALLDAATNAEPSREAPVPGDITVCLYCATVLEFADDMRLVIHETDDPRVLHIQRMIRHLGRARSRESD